MNFVEYQDNAARTSGGAGRTYDGIEGSLGERRMMVACLGLAGEAGELLDHIKKAVGHGHKLEPVLVEKEIGDVLWYVAELCTSLGLDLADVAEHNIAKLRARYPAGFSSEASINRSC